RRGSPSFILRQRNINVLQLLTCPFKPTATIRGAFPCFREQSDGIWTAQRQGQPALAAISKAADRLLCRYGDRLLGGLRQRDARHAAQRRRAGASDARKPCLR